MTRRKGSKGLTRRKFVQATALAGTGLALGCGDDDAPGRDAGPGDASPGDAGRDGAPMVDGGPPDAGPEPVIPPEPTPMAETFGLGVSSGDVTTEAAILWTRYDGTLPLEVVVWEMAGEEYARTAHRERVTPADGGFTHVEAHGLVGGRWFRYAFFEMEGDTRVGRSPVGQLRAAFADTDMAPMVIGAVSCAKNGMPFQTLEQAAARDDMDLFLLLGDTTYNDGATTVDQYRAKWAENLATAGYRGLLAKTSVLATWDDHEVENNYDPERIDPAQLAAATQVFFENMPLRRDAAHPNRVWKSIRWGRTAELFVLDCRSERLPSTRRGADAIYISREQADWLKAGLAASPAVFKIILNSVPITDFPIAFDLAADDRWEGYAAQREEILRFVEDAGIGGLLWVAGDFHLGSMGRVAASGLGSTQVETLVGPAAQTGNVLAAILGGPQFDWATSRDSYTVIELDPGTSMVRLWFRDASDSVLETRTYLL